MLVSFRMFFRPPNLKTKDPDPLEVKGGYSSDNPPVPTQVNMMRVICHPDKMDVVKPQVAECVAGYAAYAQSLPTTKLFLKSQT